jgi:hypothetical protein
MSFLGRSFAILALGASSSLAQAAPPLVDPVVVNIGTPVHLTPVDQNGSPIPIAQCSLNATLPLTIATWVKDATGVVLTAVAVNKYPGVRWTCSDGLNPPVSSNAFTVTVPPPPYNVTAVGDTMP